MLPSCMGVSPTKKKNPLEEKQLCTWFISLVDEVCEAYHKNMHRSQFAREANNKSQMILRCGKSVKY